MSNAEDFIKIGLDNVNKELIQHRNQVQSGFDTVNKTLLIIQKDYKELNEEIKSFQINYHTDAVDMRNRIEDLEKSVKSNGNSTLFRWVWKFIKGGL